MGSKTQLIVYDVVGSEIEVKRTRKNTTAKKLKTRNSDNGAIVKKAPTDEVKATDPTTDSVKKKPGRKKSTNYLNNRDLMAEVVKSKQQNQMTDKLAHMLQTLARRYATRGQFASYTYNEDMQAFAMAQLVKTWKGFNPDRSNNPFAYYTQCIKNSFRLFLRTEKRQRDTRDALLADAGYNPSINFQVEHDMSQNDYILDPFSDSSYYDDTDSDSDNQDDEQ